MMRAFELEDLEWFKPNEWSHPDDFMWCLKDDAYWKYTLDLNGKIQAIVIVRPYHPDCYQASFLIAKDMDMIAARELKRFIYASQKKLNGRRLQTDSVDCDILNKWHKFLGFTLEGKRRQMAYGKDFNCWGIVWA